MTQTECSPQNPVQCGDRKILPVPKVESEFRFSRAYFLTELKQFTYILKKSLKHEQEFPASTFIMGKSFFEVD